ncbi:hypothetical protein T4B_6183 [Trichinella pseudospiralis]|uniref:Uncharacterized protein n=2 Tax=Trichinella pseudospiralis TaxID=6337 RepID=A0A0V1HDX1_TRIPS|nr:hypothetical protein T4B_6183 [Trichinella pseudospiralis]
MPRFSEVIEAATPSARESSYIDYQGIACSGLSPINALLITTYRQASLLTNKMHALSFCFFPFLK